jgi:hypothetical protein
MTDEPTLDPHGLLDSGEELATQAELARLLGVSRAALRSLLSGPLYDVVRFVRGPKPGPWRYSVADARREITPRLPEIEARKRQAAERQEQEMAAAKAKRDAKAAAHEARPSARKAARGTAPVARKRVEAPPPRDARHSRPAPAEVFTRRRSGA